MRLLAPTLALVAALAAPASAQNLGARTTSPETMIAQMSPLSPEDEMRQSIAAADAHPLGSVENPIRVAGPDGERAYLARLRCADGSAPRVGARTDAGVGAYGSVVAAYEVGCAAAGRLVFDMYQAEHVETRAPAGFTLAPQ
jgi:hypothetical protein